MSRTARRPPVRFRDRHARWIAALWSCGWHPSRPAASALERILRLAEAGRTRAVLAALGRVRAELDRAGRDE
jgi:hypothetical protein